MRCRLRAGVALVVLGLMWGVLFLVPLAAPWIGFGVLGSPVATSYFWQIICNKVLHFVGSSSGMQVF